MLKCVISCRVFPIVLALALLVVGTSRIAAARNEPIVTSDLLRIRTVESIDVAPSGSVAVFTVRSIAAKTGNEEDDAQPDNPGDTDNGEGTKTRTQYEYRSHLYSLNLLDKNPEPKQLTFGSRKDRAPAVSPDGSRVAIVRGAENGIDKKSKPQIWVMSLTGGEARQLTKIKHGATRPKWTPDGRKLVFQSKIPMHEMPGKPTWPSERPQRTWDDLINDEDTKPAPDGSRAQIRAWLNANARDTNPHVINSLEFQDEKELRSETEFDHLFIIQVDAPRPEPRQLTGGFYDHDQHEVLPDGTGIVYVADKVTDQHPDRSLESQIYRIGLDGENDQRVLAIDGWTLRDPQPSRDGNVLAFAGRPVNDRAYRPWQLALASAQPDQSNALNDADADNQLDRDNDPRRDENVVWLTGLENFDYSVRSFQWDTARTSILFNTAMRGGLPLMTVNPGLLSPAPSIKWRNDALPFGVYDFDIGGATTVYSKTTVENPCVLHVRDDRGDRLVYDLNPWVKNKQLSTPETSWIDRPDGTRVQCWIMPPTDYDIENKYPLVLEIHGGPGAMWGPGERTMWHEFQLLTSWGFAVVYANPRGSGGYGYEFEKANHKNWGDGPMGDVLAAVDHALVNDWVDRERLVVTGGSYGGYLTSYTIAHDNRFKAAVAQRGVYDLRTFFGEGNAWRMLEGHMGGWPYQPTLERVYRRQSPLTYVQRIRTPLLIMHGSRDLRTGVSQSEMLYRALKTLGRPVEYLRYPHAGHDLSRSGDPTQRMDRLNRIIEFFERYVDNPRPAPSIEEPASAAANATKPSEPRPAAVGGSP